MPRRTVPILVSLAGACLVGLLVYGVTAQGTSRSLDQAIAEGRHPAAPQSTRMLPVLSGAPGAGTAGASSTGAGTTGARAAGARAAGGRTAGTGTAGAGAGPSSGSLAGHRGQVVVLNFWASWCIPCQTEAPLLERAQHALAAHRGGTVLGVTYLDASTDSRAFVREHHITYPNLRDTTGEFARAYGTDQLPETFVIDPTGHIVAISRGQIDQAFLDRAISLAQHTS